MMDLNPEFRRNLWLELTLHRLIAMPAVLVMVLALVYAASKDHAEAVAIAAAWIAGGLLGVWGVRSAGDCVLDEVRAHTWDSQRMSAIGPWGMTWGKLLGSVSFAWYGGLMALTVLVAISPRDWANSAAKVAALIVAGSVLTQAAACLAGLAAARKGYARRSGMGMWFLLVLLLLAGPATGLSLAREQGMNWWGATHGQVSFMLASATCFAAWAVFGLYRAMCTELQVRTTPWAFAGFTLFLTAYIAGFRIVPGAGFGRTLDALIVSAMAVGSTLTYLQLFSEQTGVIVFRRVQVRLARDEWRRAFEELPCWPVAFAFTAVACVAGGLWLAPAAAGEDAFHILYAAPIPLFLLMARDVAIFLIFAFAPRPRRVEAAAFFYYVLLYGVLPWLLVAAGLTGLAELVMPPILTSPAKAIVVATIQAAIAAAVLAWRWRASRRLDESR